MVVESNITYHIRLHGGLLTRFSDSLGGGIAVASTKTEAIV